MQELQEVYHNDIGVAFFWKKDQQILTEKVQLVFKETGLYLTTPNLLKFAKELDTTCSKICCSDCELKNRCQRYLLRTPFDGLELAVSSDEALQLKDLVEGTLFQIQLNAYIGNLCKN
ncbi:hypothetical protein [Flavobacterium sp.]|uniref:hypothetical protein n=1 Tax=Flavobacterium sp. TaxID=239 RepID=UPI0028BD3726|nr:hypothetical protein [Flavobacterium sp.]